MTAHQPTLTIITPTYNRKELTRRCYESLFRQTSFDFEWVLVDDGSTDGTAELFEALFKEETPFAKTLVTKENGGKSSALNAAHPYIRGKYLTILDSDDFLTDDAVETALKGWKKYENDPNIGIVIFLKQTPEGEFFATPKVENTPVDLLSRQVNCNISNDWAEVVRSDLFLKYPLPMFEGENYLTGTAMWYRIGLDCRVIYVRQPINICKFQEGGLSKSGKPLRIKNCKGEMYCAKLRMNPRCPIKLRLRNAILYNAYAFFAGMTFKERLKDAAPYQFLITLGYFPGKYLHLKWKRLYIDK